MILKPGQTANISQVMHFLKKNFSINANRIMNLNEYGTTGGGVVLRRWIDANNDTRVIGAEKHPRLQVNETESDVILHRQKDVNWQNIFDNNVVLPLKNQFARKYGSEQYFIPKFKWQKSFHDHVIRNEKDFQHQCHYATYNFLKHNLPEDWTYTSLNYPDLIDT